MAKLFEGKASVYVTEAGVIRLKKDDNGAVSQETVGEALAAAIAAAKKEKLPIDRWHFYAYEWGEHQKAKEVGKPTSQWEKFIPASALEKELKTGEVALEVAKWGKPRITVRPKGTVTRTNAKAKATVIF